VSTVTGAAIVAEARRFLGDPYVYGDTGPSAFDCSGLVQYVLHKLGITAPRTSEQQWSWVSKVERSHLEPGDLVFAQFPGDNAPPGHVGIYVGGGKVLSAEDPAQGVALADLSSWKDNIVGYGRAPGSATAGGGGGGGGGFSLLSLPSDVLQMFDQAATFFQKLMWIANPENWARIVAGAAGVFLMLFGIGFLVAAGV
jgi:cell wall-associated NlpC family hydrolase